MSRRNSRSSNIGVELKLNLAPRAAAMAKDEISSPETSPARSCVSSKDSVKYSSSPETSSMVVVGCPRCLMYVMLSEIDPRCPKCKSSVLLNLHTTAHRDEEDGVVN